MTEKASLRQRAATLAKREKAETKKKGWFSRRRHTTNYNSNTAEDVNDGLVFSGKDTAEAIETFSGLISLLESRGLQRVGLFRVPGNSEVVKEASEKLDAGETIENIMREWTLDDDSLVDSLATLLKQWIRCRPTSILSNEMRTLLSDRCAAGENNLTDILEQDSIAWDLFSLLADVADSPATRMPAYNLAVVFAPNLVEDPMLSVGPLIDIIAKLISSMQQSRDIDTLPSSLTNSRRQSAPAEVEAPSPIQNVSQQPPIAGARQPRTNPPPPPARRSTHPNHQFVNTRSSPSTPQGQPPPPMPPRNTTPPPMPRHTPGTPNSEIAFGTAQQASSDEKRKQSPPPPPPRLKTCSNPMCVARTQALEARIASLELECQILRQQQEERAEIDGPAGEADFYHRED